ncbi:MAG: response regulator [Rhodomicrobium sp.]
MSGPRSILVAEDEFLLAMQLETLLTEAGWTVIGPAGTLSSAVNLARSTACDAAVLDVNLKGERIDEVAGILAGRGIPFVFATGYGRDAIPALYRETAVLIAKPFNELELVQAIKGLLRQVLD